MDLNNSREAHALDISDQVESFGHRAPVGTGRVLSIRHKVQL